MQKDAANESFEIDHSFGLVIFYKPNRLEGMSMVKFKEEISAIGTY